jgi:hypothetical protein
MAKLCRMLITKALAGDLVAARWALLFLIGKPAEAVWPDAIAAREAAEAQADDPPPPIPDDHKARLDLAARELAKEFRALRDLRPVPGGVGELALADVDTPGSYGLRT